MYVAMNRFKVRPGDEAAFEELWRSREIHLDTLPGFVEFNLLRGQKAEDHTLYASHTIWADRASFEAWTRSEAFRAAHRDAGQGPKLTVGPPSFEGFEAVEGLKLTKN